MNSTFHVSQHTPGPRPTPRQRPPVSVSEQTTTLPKSKAITRPQPEPRVPRESQVALHSDQTPIKIFRQTLEHVARIAVTMEVATAERNAIAIAKYQGTRNAEESQVVATMEREIAEAEAIQRIRREKIRVKKAELNAVLENLKQDQEQTIVHTKKREARRKEAKQTLEQERSYGIVYGASYIDHINIDCKNVPGRCICPEGHTVASVDRSEEQCNFWDCPALIPKPRLLVEEPKPPHSRSARFSAHPPPPRNETVLYERTTTDLFTEIERTGDLFPDTLAPSNFYCPSEPEPTVDLFPVS